MWLYVPSGCCPSAPDSLESTSASSLRSAAERLSSSVLSKSKPTLPKFWLGAWKKGRFLLLLFGAMSGPSTLARYAESWISSLRDTRASRSPTQVFDEVLRTLDTSGQTSRGSSESADLLSSSLRTFEDMPPSGSIVSDKIWKSWVTALRRCSRVLLMSAPRICASASSGSLWPTTTTTDAKAARRHGYMLTGNAGTTLTDAALEWAEEVGPWPTTDAGPWPTTDAGPSNDGESPESWRARQARWKETYDARKPGEGPKAGNGAGLPLAIAAKEFTRDNLYATPVASENANRTQKVVPSRDRHLSAQAIALSKDMLFATPRASRGPNSTESLGDPKSGAHLSAQAVELTRDMLYPTPMAADATRGGDIFPRGNMTLPGTARVMMEDGSLPSLPDEKISTAGERISKPTLVLNPRFSEALMGLPRGWLSCARLGTESYRRWWRKHSGF